MFDVLGGCGGVNLIANISDPAKIEHFENQDKIFV